MSILMVLCGLPYKICSLSGRHVLVLSKTTLSSLYMTVLCNRSLILIQCDFLKCSLCNYSETMHWIEILTTCYALQQLILYTGASFQPPIRIVKENFFLILKKLIFGILF